LGEPAAALLAEHLDRLGHYPAFDVPYRPKPLGDWQEAPGHDQLVSGAEHAHEQLQLSNFTRGGFHHRLSVQDKAIPQPLGGAQW
jgi:hypothetical protein